MSTSNMELRVQQYRDVRERIKEIEKRHSDELEKPKLLLERIGGEIQKFLDENKLDNIKTKAGTAYVSVRYTATVNDPDAFMRFVIGGEHFDLLERRASATAVKQFVEDNNGTLPTGVNLNALSSVGVRAPTTKS